MLTSSLWSSQATNEDMTQQDEKAQIPHGREYGFSLHQERMFRILFFWICTYPKSSVICLQDFYLLGAPLMAQRQRSHKPPAGAGDMGFDLWVRKIPWRREWQPTPVFLPGKSQE